MKKIIGIVFACLGLWASEPISTKVLETITHSQNIPDELKSEVSATWSKLVQEGVIEVSGPDRDTRPCFVALQGVVEHVLSCELQKEIKSLKAIIHTPMPATPLCSKGEISKDLVDPSIEKDPRRLFTVKARTTILRDFLQRGADLYIFYPKDGITKRTEEQQNIYRQELTNYPEHLFDRPLNCLSIPDELIGAIYLFTNQAGKVFVFAIKMTQAKDPKEQGKFGLYFGPIENEAIKARVDAVLSFIGKSNLK